MSAADGEEEDEGMRFVDSVAGAATTSIPDDDDCSISGVTEAVVVVVAAPATVGEGEDEDSTGLPLLMADVVAAVGAEEVDGEVLGLAVDDEGVVMVTSVAAAADREEVREMPSVENPTGRDTESET